MELVSDILHKTNIHRHLLNRETSMQNMYEQLQSHIRFISYEFDNYDELSSRCKMSSKSILQEELKNLISCLGRLHAILKDSDISPIYGYNNYEEYENKLT